MNTHTPHMWYKGFLKLDKRSNRKKIFGDCQSNRLWLTSLLQYLQHCLADNLQFWFLFVSGHVSLTTDLNCLGVYMNAHSDQEKKLRKLQLSLSIYMSIDSLYWASLMCQINHWFLCMLSHLTLSIALLSNEELKYVFGDSKNYCKNNCNAIFFFLKQ